MKAQDWLEQNYPDKETKSIYLNQQLTGVLDCREYKNLYCIFIPSSVDSSKFEIKRGSYKPYSNTDEKKETQIIPCQSAQTYLNQWYPTQQARVEKEKGLEGTLDLSDFPNLEELDCSNNYLTQIVYPTNPEKITNLDIRNNNLNTSDLTIFSQLRNLVYLHIDNTDKNKINQDVYNRWVDSCEPLQDLNKLKRLGVKNTDLTSGWEYLPTSLEYFYYESEQRPLTVN